MNRPRQQSPLSAHSAMRYFQTLASGGKEHPPAIAMDDVYPFREDRHLLNPVTNFSLEEALRNNSVLRIPEQQGTYHQGLVWIQGTVQRVGFEVPFRCPVLFRIVQARLDRTGTFSKVVWDPKTRKRKGTWSLTPGIFSEAAAALILPHHKKAIATEMVDDVKEAVRQAIAMDFAPHAAPTFLEDLALWDGGGMARMAALQAWDDTDTQGTALVPMYDEASAASSSPPAPLDTRLKPLRNPLPLNAQQEQLVRRAVSEPLVVVSGPPGTGKTHLVAAVALEQFGQGQSTLIATASGAAAESIAEMLSRFPMVTAIRFGASVQPQILGNQLAEGVPAGESQFHTGFTSVQVDQLDAEIAEVSATLTLRLRATQANEGAIALRRSLPKWAPAEATPADIDNWQELARATRPTGRAAWAHRAWLLTKLRRAMKAPRSTALSDLQNTLEVLARIVAAEMPMGDTPTARLWEQLESLRERRSTAAANHLEALRRTATGGDARRKLGQLATALRHAHPVDRQFALAEQPKEFTDSVPLWFGTLQDIENTLPAQSGLFDLVIIDEASQASQIHGMSALIRAKRAMIIGDPRQMRHSPVSTAGQRQAAARASGIDAAAAAQVDEGAVSLFDAAAHQAPVTRLAEHFRCSPHIIGFCNERFYDDRLRLMTQHPGRESRDAIHIVSPVGTEIQAVVAQIEKLTGFGTRSIGVVACYEAHAAALRLAVSQRIAMRDQKRVALRIGTPREFQGIERDSILISPGIGPANLELLDELQDPNTFNVVVSRAQNDVYVVTPLTPDELPEGLLRDYLDWSHRPPEPLSSQAKAIGWKGDLARDLGALEDLRVIVDYPVGGHTVDLAIGVGRLAFGVETSVHPDGVEAHIERHLALRRAGWHMIDAFETDWTGRQSECVAWLATQWQQRQ